MIEDGLEPAWIEQVDALDARFRERRGAPGAAGADLRPPPRGSALDADVLLAGGGLSLLYAVALARAGVRVAVADPRGVGKGHREWNASIDELRALHEGSALEEAQVGPLVAARYLRGLVRWHGGAPLFVRGVLDASVDAQGLLDALRARALSLGVRLLEGVAVGGHRSGPGGVRAELLRPGGARPEAFAARLLLDGRGAASPFARWDLVCPTVGGVLRGLPQGPGPDEVDPDTGEILVSIEGSRGGVQPIWEGFPGRGGDFTAYLFEYTEPRRLGPRPLRDLYARFFASLPRYKRAGPGVRLLRPAFGFIPAYTRLRPAPTAPDDRVLLVGDAAARHSPLTFCGFGSALRSYGPVSARLLRLLDRDRLDRRALAGVWSEHGSLSVQGALALMMIDRGGLRTGRDPQAINRLLDAAFHALAAQGEDVFRDFLQDRASPAALWRMLRGTAAREPGVYPAALRNLSAAELAAFAARFASFAAGARRGAPA